MPKVKVLFLTVSSIAISSLQSETIFMSGKFQPSGAEKAISAIRAMLREKKGGLSTSA